MISSGRPSCALVPRASLVALRCGDTSNRLLGSDRYGYAAPHAYVDARHRWLRDV